MRGVLRAFVVLQVLLPLCALAADENVLVELNSIESADNRCRLNFVVQNKSRVAIESMKLDLVAFGAVVALQHPLRPLHGELLLVHHLEALRDRHMTLDDLLRPRREDLLDLLLDL